MTCRIAVLLSGRGSNLDAILQQVHQAPEVPAQVVGVVSNRPAAGGLQRAAAAGVATCCVDHRAYPDRPAFEADLARALDSLQPDLLVLAGFMRILTPEFVTRYSPHLLNIHPSLLPAFRGLDTHARAIAAGHRQHGSSVHVVVPELDAGPVIAQVQVPIEEDDTPESLAARVQQGEHLLYPRVLQWYASGRLQLTADAVQLDGRTLGAEGHRFRLQPEAPCLEACL